VDTLTYNLKHLALMRDGCQEGGVSGRETALLQPGNDKGLTLWRQGSWDLSGSRAGADDSRSAAIRMGRCQQDACVV